LLKAVRRLPLLRREVWRLDGEEASSGEPLSVLIAAGDQTRNYLRDLLFRRGVRETALGRQWLWNLASARRARRSGCSVIVIDANPFVRRLLDEEKWFFIPLWIVGIVALPIPEEVAKRKSIRWDLAALSKAGLSYRVSKERACFDDFYHNMYAPHATKTHGASVHLTPCDEMWSRLERGDLILLHDGNKDVAGLTILYEESRPRLWALGVRDGEPPHVQRAALSAVYPVCFEHLVANRHDSVNLGLSRAFLDDGVLGYKRKWGHKIVGTAKTRIALRVVADTPASGALLRANPFIFERAGRMYGAVFLSEQHEMTVDAVERLRKQYHHDGLSKLCLFTPEETAGRGLELPPDVELRRQPSYG
jgi:hypothetical protein